MDPSTSNPSAMADKAEGVGESKPTAWRPRWRSNPDAVPTPYDGPIQKQRINPEPGEYRMQSIAEKLQGAGNHSFMMKQTQGTSIDSAQRVDHEALDVVSPSSPQVAEEAIVAIMYHRGSNPATSYAVGESREIWTRNNFAAIYAHTGVPLPFFIYSHSPSSDAKWKQDHTTFYVYAGMFAITEIHLAKGRSQEVVDFLKEREESKTDKSREIWRSKLNSDWLGVRVDKCQAELQKPDPIKGRCVPMRI